ncbi:hypothetical protein HanPI659440_Chr13g0503451 [Helianthus annuus]|nr:hypothetical protein HanPI659440_Chr13g0503451 [Helianthus annuus]
MDMSLRERLRPLFSEIEWSMLTGIKGESTKELIDRYVELYLEMRRLNINQMDETWIDKLANALPNDVWGTYLLARKKNGEYYSFNLSSFVEKIQAQELEFQKIKKLKSDSREKNHEAATAEVKVKSEEIVQEVEEQVKEISAIKTEKKAEAGMMSGKCLNCENLKSENAKLLRDLESLTLENKNFKNLENEKVKIEKDFQDQIKILEDEKDIFGKNNLEKQITINSDLAKIIQLEKEAESDRNKIAD